MQKGKVQASLRIHTDSHEPLLFAQVIIYGPSGSFKLRKDFVAPL